MQSVNYLLSIHNKNNFPRFDIIEVDLLFKTKKARSSEIRKYHSIPIEIDK